MNEKPQRTQTEIASELANREHAGQFRRDGKTPYIEHPKAVALRLSGESDEVTAAAWLHDVLEDCKTSPDDLRKAGISENVVKAVETLTRGDEDYSSYLHKVKSNNIARKVKFADMLHNLSDQPTERQIAKYAEGFSFLLADTTSHEFDDIDALVLNLWDGKDNVVLTWSDKGLPNQDCQEHTIDWTCHDLESFLRVLSAAKNDGVRKIELRIVEGADEGRQLPSNLEKP